MMYCSREGECCYWFHCDSRCLCRPQRCQGLHLQGVRKDIILEASSFCTARQKITLELLIK